MAEPLFRDPSLQAAYRELMREAAAAGAHLDEATWERLAGGDRDAEGREAAFDHVVSCADCARVWRGLLALRSDAEAGGLVARMRPRADWWRQSFVPLAAAASVILAVGIFYLNRPAPPVAETTRTGTALSSIEALMVARTPEGVPAFAWAPVVNATRYRIEVFTDDGRPVWSLDVDRPPIEWPAGVPRSAGTYRWRVEAMTDGATIARSPITRSEIDR